MLQINALEEFLKVYTHEKYSEKELEVICKNLYTFVKEKMNKEDFCLIRIKYIGSFHITKGPVKGLLNIIKAQFNNGYLEEDRYKEMESHLLKLLKEVEK